MQYSRRAFLSSLAAGATATVVSAAPSDPAWERPEKPDKKLQKLVDDRIKAFRGEVGVYVRHLPSGRTAVTRPDELFPTASLIKVGIMLALFDRIERGELSYHQYMTYDGTYVYQGKNDDILSRFKLGETIRLSKLIMLMITISDNSASRRLPELAGGGGRINEVLAAHGPYDVIHFNMGLHGWQKGRIKEGQFTPLTRKLVETFRQNAPKARLIWASSTPVTVKNKPTELSPEINPVIIEHNRLAGEVMKEMDVPVNDLYALLVGRLELARGDQFHWKGPAYSILAKTIAASVIERLPARHASTRPSKP